MTLFLLFCPGYTLAGLLLSLPPTIYPKVAEDKGASPAQYGIAFGIYHLSACLAAPLSTRLRTTLGAKVVCILGFALQTIGGGLAFAWIQEASNLWVFLGLSYVLR